MRRNTGIALLAAGHACVDVYQGSVAALVPFFVAQRQYALAAASGLVLAASLLSSVAQPLFGAIADRFALPWLLPGSMLLGGAGIAVCGLSGSYGWTLAFVALSGIGVAAYHPEAARVARLASEGSHRAMAYFSTGGNFGFALAPLMVAAVVGVNGLRWTPMLILPAIAGVSVTIPVLRGLQRRQAKTTAAVASGRDDVRSFAKLSLAVVFRSIAFVGLSTFIALFVQGRMGGSSFAGTAALFILFFGGVIGSVWGGYLASRWDRATVTRWAYLVSIFAIEGVVTVPGPAVYPFIALTSVGLYVPFSLQITLAQDYLPSRVGTASGVALGLTVSIGGLASPVIGTLAQVTTLQIALIPLIAMPLASWLCFRSLRDPESPAKNTDDLLKSGGVKGIRIP
ncbi:MFS transporter [Mycobacterium sp. NPDC003449]